MAIEPALDAQPRSLDEAEGTVRCAGGIVIARRTARVTSRTNDTSWVGAVGPVAAVDRPNRPGVEARRGDGVVWRRHWREEHRLLIEFVGLSLVSISLDTGRITFDSPLAPDVEDHLLLDHVVPMLLAERGHLVLHGALVSHGGSGAVLVGASGAGKSTLAAYLWQRGWTLGGDDGTVLAPCRPPTAEPTYATLRLSPTSTEMLSVQRFRVARIAGKDRLAATGALAFDPAPVPVALIAVVEPTSHVQSTLRPMTGVDAHSELFGSMFHAGFSDPAVVGPVVDGLASVVESVHVGHLTVPRGVDGLASAEGLLRHAVVTARTEAPR